MCLACIAIGALVVAGATSAGGLTALIVKTLHVKTGAKSIDPSTQTGGEQDEAQPGRVSRRSARTTTSTSCRRDATKPICRRPWRGYGTTIGTVTELVETLCRSSGDPS
jgi:hypothetical protein